MPTTTKPRQTANLAARLAVTLLVGAGLAQGAGAAEPEQQATFRIGMLGEPGSDHTITGLSAIRAAYSHALGQPVEVFVARDYPSLVDAQINRRIDYAVYSATAYAAAWRLCECVEPVAAPQGADGAIGIRAVLIVRQGLAATVAEALKLRIAAGPEDSLTGRLMAAGATIAPDDIGASAAVEGLGGGHSASAALAAFVSGDADGLFGWARTTGEEGEALSGGTLALLADRGLTPDEFDVVWTSPPVPFGPHAVRADLDAEIKRRLAVFLRGLYVSDRDTYDFLEPDHDGGFVASTHAGYVPVVEALALAVPEGRRR